MHMVQVGSIDIMIFQEHQNNTTTKNLTTMKLTNEFEPIREWATEKGIIPKGDINSQFLKLVEEVGELSNGIQKRNNDEIKDAIGDCVVVLTNLAAVHGGFTIEECVNSAYAVIKNRTGKMVDGVFVKEASQL